MVAQDYMPLKQFPGRLILLVQVARLHLTSRGSWSGERNNMFLKCIGKADTIGGIGFSPKPGV